MVLLSEATEIQLAKLWSGGASAGGYWIGWPNPVGYRSGLELAGNNECGSA